MHYIFCAQIVFETIGQFALIRKLQLFRKLNFIFIGPIFWLFFPPQLVFQIGRKRIVRVVYWIVGVVMDTCWQISSRHLIPMRHTQHQAKQWSGQRPQGFVCCIEIHFECSMLALVRLL